jgi:hypothetical protein
MRVMLHSQVDSPLTAPGDEVVDDWTQLAD